MQPVSRPDPSTSQPHLTDLFHEEQSGSIAFLRAAIMLASLLLLSVPIRTHLQLRREWKRISRNNDFSSTNLWVGRTSLYVRSADGCDQRYPWSEIRSFEQDEHIALLFTSSAIPFPIPKRSLPPKASAGLRRASSSIAGHFHGNGRRRKTFY